MELRLHPRASVSVAIEIDEVSLVGSFHLQACKVFGLVIASDTRLHQMLVYGAREALAFLMVRGEPIVLFVVSGGTATSPQGGCNGAI
jgi:hypothetical protein